MNRRFEITDDEWERLAPLLPSTRPERGGRWRDHRQALNGILFRVRTGVPWRDLPDRVARFRSEACFAMHAGVAPIPVSSGRTDRHRLCRGGNRQLNAAVHRIAITQLRLAGPGQSYYRRRRAQGDRTGDAVRALKRRIARAVYQQLKLAEERLRTAAPAAA